MKAREIYCIAYIIVGGEWKKYIAFQVENGEIQLLHGMCEGFIEICSLAEQKGYIVKNYGLIKKEMESNIDLVFACVKRKEDSTVLKRKISTLEELKQFSVQSKKNDVIWIISDIVEKFFENDGTFCYGYSLSETSKKCLRHYFKYT